MFCQKCGKENDDNATFCQGCGDSLNGGQSPQGMNQPPPQQYAPLPPPIKKKKPLYKRVWFWLIVVFAGIPVLSGIINGGKTTPASTGISSSSISSSKPESSSKAESVSESPAVQGEGDIGKYHIKIVSAEMGQEYDGTDCIIVNYEWTNNSDEPKAFSYAITATAFQNGIECSTPVMTPDGVDWQDKTREIKPGTSFAFKIAYTLNDLDTPVEIECKGWITLNKNPPIITKTFELPL